MKFLWQTHGKTAVFAWFSRGFGRFEKGNILSNIVYYKKQKKFFKKEKRKKELF